MPAASGFQVATFIFAFNFLVMYAIRVVGERLSMPAGSFQSVDQFVIFGLGIAMLLAIPPVRRFCRDELGRPVPASRWRETAVVSLGIVAIPFAMAGATVLAAFAVGEPGTLPTRLLHADPMIGWERAFATESLTRQVVVSWVAAPLVEELVFRGLLYRAWERQLGWMPSALLTSACFGLFHIHNFTASFLISLVLIGLLRRTGSLRAPILAHATYNILVWWPVLGHMLLTIDGREINRMSTWSVELAGLVFVAVALPAYLAMSRADVREAHVR